MEYGEDKVRCEASGKEMGTEYMYTWYNGTLTYPGSVGPRGAHNFIQF